VAGCIIYVMLSFRECKTKGEWLIFSRYNRDSPWNVIRDALWLSLFMIKNYCICRERKEEGIMGEKDIAEKLLADHNDVFADIVNVLLFGGKMMLGEEELENTKDKSMYKADGKIHEQERDLSKFWKSKRVVIALLGMENQTEEDKDMPFRVIGYDGASYRTQCLSGKKERYPVVTIVLHFGTESKWSDKRRLSDCVEVPDELEPYFHDYGVNVFDIAFLPREQIDMFQSDFGIVADYFYQKRVLNDYKPSNTVIKHVDEVMKLLAVLTKSDDFVTVGEKLVKEGGNVTMCLVVDRIKTESKEEGRAEGIAEGELKKLVHLVEKKLLSLKDAAADAKMTESDFCEMAKRFSEK